MNPETFDENEPLLEERDLPREVWEDPAISPNFRQAVLIRTAAVLRSRTRRRRMAFAGALIAASYAGGIATAWFILQTEPPVQRLEQDVASAQDVSEDVAPAEPVVTDAQLRDPESFALLLAKSPVDEQMEILKVAGDRYLEDFGDIEQAMNCYRRLLSLQQPDADVAVNLDDSWLLKSMKQARL
jgi:hypothetical protein